MLFRIVLLYFLLLLLFLLLAILLRLDVRLLLVVCFVVLKAQAARTLHYCRLRLVVLHVQLFEGGLGLIGECLVFSERQEILCVCCLLLVFVKSVVAFSDHFGVQKSYLINKILIAYLLASVLLHRVHQLILCIILPLRMKNVLLQFLYQTKSTRIYALLLISIFK